MFDHPLLQFGERCVEAGFVPIGQRATLWERIGAEERACSPEDEPTEGVLSIDEVGGGRWDGWRGRVATVTASLPTDPDHVEAEQDRVIRDLTAIFGEPRIRRGHRDTVCRWRVNGWTIEVSVDAVERNRVELTVADRELLDA